MSGTQAGANNLERVLKDRGLALCLGVRAFRSIEIAAVAPAFGGPDRNGPPSAGNP